MTRRRFNRFVTLACAGMILCWFDVSNGLVMPALSRSPLSVPLAALILAWSACIAMMNKAWSLPRGGVLMLHVTGLLVTLAAILHASGDPAYAFYDFRWTTRTESFTWIVWQWLILAINMLWSILLYCCGYNLYGRRLKFLAISLRLDIGISLFFLVLMAKLVTQHKGVVIPYEHTLGRQLVCFMMLGLFAMSIARNQASHRSSTISYYKGAGMVLSFGLAATIFGAAMVMLFLPDLINGALWGKALLDRGWPMIEHAATLFANSDFMARWIENVSVHLCNFVLKTLRLPPRLSDGEINPLYAKIVLGMGLFYAAVVLWFLIEWLLHKSDKNGKKPGPWVILRIMARRLKRLVMAIIRFLTPQRDPLNRVEHYYLLLQKWGTRSGLPRAVSETPNEYGARLSVHFPGLAPQIAVLIEMFNLARYRGVISHKYQLKEVRANWKQLRSPKLWPLRAKLWLFQART